MNENGTLDPALLKALFARLVASCGKQDAAAARLGISRQRISQLCSANPEHAKDIPTWGQVFALESACDRSIVFAELARLSEPTKTPAGDPMSHACGLVKEVADVLAAVQLSMADGATDDAEVERLENELADVDQMVAKLRAAIRRPHLRVAN